MKKIQIIPKKLSRHRKDLDFIVFQQPVNLKFDQRDGAGLIVSTTVNRVEVSSSGADSANISALSSDLKIDFSCEVQ